MHGVDALHYHVIHCTFIRFFIMVVQKKLYIFIADHTVVKGNREMFKNTQVRIRARSDHTLFR